VKHAWTVRFPGTARWGVRPAGPTSKGASVRGKPPSQYDGAACKPTASRLRPFIKIVGFNFNGTTVGVPAGALEKTALTKVDMPPETGMMPVRLATPALTAGRGVWLTTLTPPKGGGKEKGNKEKGKKRRRYRGRRRRGEKRGGRRERERRGEGGERNVEGTGGREGGGGRPTPLSQFDSNTVGPLHNSSGNCHPSYKTANHAQPENRGERGHMGKKPRTATMPNTHGDPAPVQRPLMQDQSGDHKMAAAETKRASSPRGLPSPARHARSRNVKNSN